MVFCPPVIFLPPTLRVLHSMPYHIDIQASSFVLLNASAWSLCGDNDGLGNPQQRTSSDFYS